MNKLPQLWVLEFSHSENVLIAITLQEQITANRMCLLSGIKHDFYPVMYFETREELEVEAEFVRNKIGSEYLGHKNRIS